MGTIFPLDTAASRPTSSRHGGDAIDAEVVGPVQPSRDALHAAFERCPALRPLHAECLSAGPMRSVRRERIVAALLELLPRLPERGDLARTAHLCSCSYAEIYDVQARHVNDGAARRYHHTLLPAWVDLEGEERYFAQRCAVALVEAFCGQLRLHVLSA